MVTADSSDVENPDDDEASARVSPAVRDEAVVERLLLLFVASDALQSRAVENGGSPLGKVGMPFRPCIPAVNTSMPVNNNKKKGLG